VDRLERVELLNSLAVRLLLLRQFQVQVWV